MVDDVGEVDFIGGGDVGECVVGVLVGEEELDVVEGEFEAGYGLEE